MNINAIINSLYNTLFFMTPVERNKVLFELFGWEGQAVYRFIQDARLKTFKE